MTMDHEDDEEGLVLGYGDDEGDGDDEEDEMDREIAIERLQNMMGDAQQRMGDADAGDLNPADAYRLIFKNLGWADADIEEAINDAERGYEDQLYDRVGSDAYASVLLEKALEQIEAGMLAAVEQGNAPTP